MLDRAFDCCPKDGLVSVREVAPRSALRGSRERRKASAVSCLPGRKTQQARHITFNSTNVRPSGRKRILSWNRAQAADGKRGRR